MLKKLFRWVILPLLGLFLVFHMGVVAMLGLWKVVPVTNSMFMLSHRLQGGDVVQTWVDYESIAKTAKQAAIASEDGQFSYHDGFDFDSIEKAIKKNEKKGKVSVGGSTISQQLAKNLFLTSHRSYIRKGEEAIITVLMESMWDKRRILEVYLNVVEFGNGIYGIEAAAQHYYGKSAKNLSREQAAWLLSILPNPKYYESHRNARGLRKKQQIVMRRMGLVKLPD
ncbi:monofunctional biosynthetic peptidoglycan transglycosylase [Moraxella nasovis]|uniref:monofunctional biosynthetic peptidoglycan transglycosylase n=1 Tax=Moraxella nasovis TaxID=2904121 RepID=UPI001F6237FF|nr:monofunctional biosynthetic peptidoglycan transglycosylase [Moraxella nasovis]UNU73625.1 monofunctional biosynthetic peptidoglycan transglycosylase [Moraxella nasovis]